MVSIPTTEDNAPQRMSITEYFALEDSSSEIKYEYARGKVYAMTGASWYHNLINTNTSTALHNQLRDTDCNTVSNDLRLKVDSKSVSFRYPDVMVICEDPHFVEDRTDTIDNPTLIIEILSPSSVMRDFNEKLGEYTALPSVQTCLLIAQHEAKVHQYSRRDNDTWLYTQHTGRDTTLPLPAIDCQLLLADVYANVDFDADADEAAAPSADTETESGKP